MQIVVTQHNVPYDPFMGAMEQLKAAMLCWYAKEFGIIHEVHYHEHFTWYEVKTDENTGISLINKLALRGCTDIHVHTIDDTSADILEFSHRGLFRICRNEFRAN